MIADSPTVGLKYGCDTASCRIPKNSAISFYGPVPNTPYQLHTFVLTMHMPLHHDHNLRFAQAEQIASLIAAQPDHLKRHGTPTVDNTQYPIVSLSQREYDPLRSGP
ncbi:hypothetical protein AC579_4826 [Pseudocercospora musae]|uniref:Uncharacterized protein n=1 Tax=Pseudocercospora musae TaxID=113226 RepID=A0A139IIC0_9PEZI|nr:hypothetical protein AC579_4826 [Pseudocercospora musae]